MRGWEEVLDFTNVLLGEGGDQFQFARSSLWRFVDASRHIALLNSLSLADGSGTGTMASVST